MKKRLVSIDVLRGITIFLMILVNTPGSWSYIYAPLNHSEWHGCTLTDLVFPSFLFIIGISLFMSLQNTSVSKRILITKMTKRAGVIFLIGLLLNWFPFYDQNITQLRIFGVLQRIALAFLGAGLCIIFFKKKLWILYITITLLIGHWLLLSSVGLEKAYSISNNIGRTVDLFVIGKNHMYQGFGIAFDPEGILGTLSSIAQILLGYLVACSILSDKSLTLKKNINLAIIAVIFIIIGWFWGYMYPINKPLWTGSYVLFTSGIITLLWALLLFFIDLKKIAYGTFVFKVFGLNSLISYILSILLIKIMSKVLKFNTANAYDWSYQNIFQPVFGNYLGSFMFAFCYTWLIWGFAYWLYTKKKIIKI